MKEVMKHLRALVYEKRIKEIWSQYLPLVQRIINYSVDVSIETMPARVILGDLADSDLAMDLPQDWADLSVADYLLKLQEAHAILIKVSRDFLDLNQKKRGRDGGAIPSEGSKLREGQYVLVQYPNRPPNKLAGLYRGPGQ
jgi:hypothetical protein